MCDQIVGEILKTTIPIIVAGLFAIAGTLGAQWISGRNTLKAKRLEILFIRKSDSYAEFLEKAGVFVADCKNQSKYLELRTAIQRAVIVASQDVADLLDLNPKTSIQNEAIGLRVAESEADIMDIQMKGWRLTMDKLMKAMRSDLEDLK